MGFFILGDKVLGGFLFNNNSETEKKMMFLLGLI
jgi:hypothetical protein